MTNILFIKSGSKLSVSKNNIVIKNNDDKNEVHITDIKTIIVENLECSITAKVNVLCAQNNIDIIYCDNKYSPVATSTTFNSYYRQLKRIEEQINWKPNRKRKLFMNIVIQKTKNQHELLKYLNKNSDQLELIDKHINEIDITNFELKEAVIAKIYFNCLFGTKFSRIDDSEINMSLNYGYALLRSKIKQIICAKGLIPALGLWHKNQFNNFNLADDIIEVYRPMVDYIIYMFLIKDDNFSNEKRVYLKR
jgi:CRISPR-associated protein Cas1